MLVTTFFSYVEYGHIGNWFSTLRATPSTVFFKARSLVEKVSLVTQLVKIRTQCGIPGFDPWVGKIPWRRERLPAPVFWPGEFYGLVHGVTKNLT